MTDGSDRNESKGDPLRPRRSGTIFRYVPAKPDERYGHYVVRCSAPDGTRPLFHLDPSPESPKARKRAERTAEAISEELWTKGLGAAPKRQRATKPSEGETVADYAGRWFKDRERRGLSSVSTDRGRFTNHVEPLIGPRPIRDVTRDEIRGVVERLDDTTSRGVFSWRTAIKVWGLVTKMFSDACDSKVAALRVRKDNPCTGIPGPDRGERKAKQWLYPVEVSALVACADVPIRWRRLYALATYLYLRPGELAALEWKDVIAEHSYVSIHQALDLRSGKTKPTKTGITRKVPIRPELAPLLDAMREESGDAGRVVQHDHENKEAEHGFPPLEDLAATLRIHLKRAKVERADLHEDRATTKRITFYDLRATGITWEVLAGTDHVRIMQRAGHLNFSTTQGYIREAEAVGLAAGAPFPALPESLSQALPQDVGQRVSSADSLTKSSVPNGIRRHEESHDRAELGSIGDRELEATATQSDAKCANARPAVTACDDTSARSPEVRTAWQSALDAALRAKATEVAEGLTATPASDAIARAFLRELELARVENRWADVAQLARALEAHQRAQASVVSLAGARAKRRPAK